MISRDDRRFNAVMARLSDEIQAAAKEKRFLLVKGSVFISTHENHDAKLSFQVRDELFRLGYQLDSTPTGFKISW